MKAHLHILIAAALAGAFGTSAQAQLAAPPAPAAAPAAPARPMPPGQAPTPATAPPAGPIGPIGITAPAAPPAPATPAVPAGEGRMYTPGAFEGVEIGGAAEVRYVQGDVDQVWVAGPAEVQRSLNMDVHGRVLRIQSEGGWRFWTSRRLQVQITSRTLSRLAILGAADVLAAGPVKGDKLTVHISGAGLARFDQLNVEQLSFSVSGAGDGQVAGQTRELSVVVSGKGEFRGEDLQAQRARLTISGIGDVKVWAVEELGITVAGIGQVEYWGNPRVRQKTSGPSSITPRGAKVPAP